MEELGWRRSRIDELDETIAELLKERLELAREIGNLKAKRQIPVKDGAREQIVLDHVRTVIGDAQLADAVVRVYEQLLKESRALQGADDPAAGTAKRGSNSYFPRVLIIGCGLIGGALARQIKAKSPETVVIGCDKQSVIDAAKASNAIDEAVTDWNDAIGKASLIVLAAGPRQNIELLKQIAPLTKRRQVVIDVTSTKGAICKVADEIALKADFIGGHPLFGSQKSGFGNSSDVEVIGKTFVLTPTSKSTELAMRRLSRWLEQLGLNVERRDAKVHDDTVSNTSHIVQLLSIALGSHLAAGRTESELRQCLKLSGPALMSVARLMASPYGLWSEILEQNKSSVCESLSSLETRLSLLRSAVKNGQVDVLESQFSCAKRVPDNLL